MYYLTLLLMVYFRLCILLTSSHTFTIMCQKLVETDPSVILDAFWSSSFIINYTGRHQQVPPLVGTVPQPFISHHLGSKMSAGARLLEFAVILHSKVEY